MRFSQFARYLPILATINASEAAIFSRILSDNSGPPLYARSRSAARPENYRKRHVTRTGHQEKERHLRQVAAGQLDFSASDPIIWRNRSLVPVYVTDTKAIREFGRLIRRRFNRDRKRQARHVH